MAWKILCPVSLSEQCKHDLLTVNRVSPKASCVWQRRHPESFNCRCVNVLQSASTQGCLNLWTTAYTTDKYLRIKYAGHTVRLHHVYPPLLLEIQKRVEEFMKAKFNHVMLNYYEDGSRTIGKHRDTDANKVRDPLPVSSAIWNNPLLRSSRPWH